MIQELMRGLLLPVRSSLETERNCASALSGALSQLKIADEDCAAWMSVEQEKWRRGQPSKAFAETVDAVLGVADADYGAIMRRVYFRLIEKLKAANLGVNHDDAVLLLSHLLLVLDLATKHRMSAAQIARVVGKRDERVQFTRQVVSLILKACRKEAKLSLPDIKNLWEKESAEEIEYFSDADSRTAAEMICDAGRAAGYGAPLRHALNRLWDHRKDTAAHTPHLQMLLYQCVIAEYWDHALTDIYEFKPRGEIGRWLFKQFPASLSGAANPFLNNAKAFEQLTPGWARSKKKSERTSAAALVEILLTLEDLGFGSRRQISRLLRLWVHRILRLAKTTHKKLPTAVTDGQCAALLDAVAAGNTGTLGILEQRVVDLVASARHEAEAGWRCRGRGDSVNASNLSRRKLGDIDFQNATKRCIVAYEAHGGQLSEVYAASHIQTLERSVSKRVNELEGVASPQEWSAKVIFVSHSIESRGPSKSTLHELPIEFEYVTFQQFLDGAKTIGSLSAKMQELVLDPLGSMPTPPRVIDRAISLLGKKQ